MNWKEKVSLVSVWHNDSSSVSTLEKKTLKICHVLENLNHWDIENIRRGFEENPRIVLVGSQKNLVHQKHHTSPEDTC